MLRGILQKIALGVVALVMAVVGVGGVVNLAFAEGDDAASDEEATKDISSLRISPSGTRVKLTAGTVLEGTHEGCVSSLSSSCSIQVQNPGEKAFRYKVYVTPYRVTGSNNELSFSDEGNSARVQIARWTQVKNSAGEYVDEAIFEIGPGETQVVDYRVTIPDDIPGGSQYAVIWAQILNDDEAAGGIQTLGQVGSVLTGRSDAESREEAVISDVNMTRFTFGGDLKAGAKVENIGNTDFEIKTTYKAKTFFGKEIYNAEDKVAAYPEISYDVEMEWENPPLLGIFSVEFKVFAADAAHTESHIVVIMPIFVIILLILLLTVVVVWIIIIIRKRKERKARKLV